jgi:SAM-dependent methyltransferase
VVKFAKGNHMIVRSIRQRNPDDPVVDSFIRRYILCPETFVSRIDENDEMLRFELRLNKGDRLRAVIGYYTIGSRIFDTIKHVGNWHFNGLENVGSFLDFAGGYGRSTRFLSRELALKRIWTCDIYPKAVAFQKRHYGVNGIVSVPDPKKFPTKRKFDFIFASSFFSHMPETTFGRWMETLYGLLTERGILVFSTHDISLRPPSKRVPETGILFMAKSESQALDHNQYGSTYVSEDFVSRVVDRVTAGRGHLHRINRGLNRFQDLYIVAKHLHRDFAALNLVHDPAGYLDTFQHTGAGEVYLSGWAADFNAGGSIEKVQVLSNGRLIATTVPRQDRADVAAYFQVPSIVRSGWSIHLSSDECGHDSIIEVKCVNNNGITSTLVFDYAKSLVLKCDKSVVKWKTVTSRIKRAPVAVKEWCRENLHLPIGEQHQKLSGGRQDTHCGNGRHKLR